VEHTETPLEQVACLLGFDAEMIQRTTPEAIAAYVVDRFNGQVLDETAVALALCDIVLDVPFGDGGGEDARRVRGKAVGFLGEIVGAGNPFSEFGAEEAAVVQGMLSVQGLSIDEVRVRMQGRS
jgi:hypothetical protein